MLKYSNRRLLFISFTVYIFVNLFENIIHYNIGKHSNHDIKIEIPTKKDWSKIIIIMISFALLQGVFTCVLNNWCK